MSSPLSMLTINTFNYRRREETEAGYSIGPSYSTGPILPRMGPFCDCLSPTRAPCQPASLAHSMFTSGWSASPGPWGSSCPPDHSAPAAGTWGPVAAPWFHSKASDTAGTPPAETPTGRGQHWSQVRLFFFEGLAFRGVAQSAKNYSCRSGGSGRKASGSVGDAD